MCGNNPLKEIGKLYADRYLVSAQTSWIYRMLHITYTWPQIMTLLFVRWTKRDTFYTYILSYMKNFMK